MDPGSTRPLPAFARFKRKPGTATGEINRKVEITDEQSVPTDHERLGKLGLFALNHVDTGSTEVDVTLVDTDRITALNREHMHSDGATDVLAFPMDLPGEAHDGVPSILGDVVICPQIAADQAVDHSAQEETEMLLVHGILHLLGHDHAEAYERDVMFGLTDTILSAFREDVQ